MKYTWTWFWITFPRPCTEWRDTTAEPSRPCPWFTSRYTASVFVSFAATTHALQDHTFTHLLPQCIVRTKLVTHVRLMWGEECSSTLSISPNLLLMNNWFFGKKSAVLFLPIESFRSSTAPRSFSLLNFLIPHDSGLSVKQQLAGNVVSTCACFLSSVVHVPAVQESGLHPLIWDLPSGHQAPKSAAGSRDRCSETLRLWQVRSQVFYYHCLRSWICACSQLQTSWAKECFLELYFKMSFFYFNNCGMF